MNRIIIFCILMVGLFMRSYAQDCFQKIENLKRSYFNGDFISVEQFDVSCLSDKSVSISLKVESYKILIELALLRGETNNARVLMKGMLTINPGYKLQSTDRSVFRDLYGQFKVERSKSLGLTMGFNQSDYQVLRYHSYAVNTEEPRNYQSFTGFSGGINYTQYIYSGLGILVGFELNTTSYFQKEVLLTNREVSLKESFFLYSFPVVLKYDFPISSRLISLGAGASLDHLNRTNGEIVYRSLPPDGLTTNSGVTYLDDHYNMSTIRNKRTYNLIGSLSTQLPLTDYLDVRFSVVYQFGLNNLVDIENRFRDTGLVKTYSYISDDFKRDMFSLKIGLVRNFYRTKMKNDEN